MESKKDPLPHATPEDAAGIEEALNPEKRVYSDDHVCPIKEARMAKKRRPPAHPVVKWASRLVMGLAVIPIIVVLAFIGAITFMDFNQYKTTIESEFQARTGYPLNIEGELDVSVWPFALEASQVAMQDKTDPERPDLAKIDSIQVEFSLWDLFVNRKLDILGVELEGAHLYLETDKNGRSNWHGMPMLSHFLPEPKATFRTVAYQPVVNSAESRQGNPPSFHWRLNSFVSQNAVLEWRNEENGHTFLLDDFDLMAFDIAPDEPFKLLTNFAYQTNVVKSRFHVNLSTELTVNETLKQWQLADWNGNIRMILPKETKVPEVRVETTGKAFKLDMEQKTFHVEQVKLSSLKTQIETSLQGQYGAHPQTEGEVKAEHIRLRKWFRHSGIEYPHFVNRKVLRDVSATFRWKQTARQLNIDDLEMLVDGAKIAGHIQRQKQAGRPDQYRFDIAVSELDMDQYEAYVNPPPKKRRSAETAAQPKPTAPVQTASGKKPETYLPIALPVNTLKELDAEGRLTIGQLKAWQMVFTHFDLTLAAKDGQLKLAPLNADLYQGKLRSELAVDVTGNTPAYDWKGTMNAIQLKPFLADGWQYHQLDGAYSGGFDLQTRGVNSYLLRQNMNGRITAKVSDGAFVGMDLNKLLAGQKTQPQDATQFSQLSLTGNIQKGILKTKDFKVKSRRFSATGLGSLELTSTLLDSTLYTVYQNPPKSLRSLKGMKVPVYLKGPLDQLKWSVDMKALLNNPDNQQKLLQGLQQLFQS